VWNGVPCTVLYEYETQYKFYVSNGRVIGYEKDGYDSIQYTFEYTGVAYAEDFVLDDEFKSCVDDVHKPIQELPNCKLESRKFTPAALPCAYTVEYTLKQNELSYDIKGYEAGYGNYISFYSQYKVHNQDNKDGIIQRIDIHDAGKNTSAAVFSIHRDPDNNMCTFVGYNDPYDKNLEKISLIHGYITSDIVYRSKKTNVVFNGEKCDELIDDKGTSYYIKDGRVVGVVMGDDDFTELELSLSYEDYAYENDFVIPSDITSCKNYEEAYNPPEKVNGCEIRSGDRPSYDSSSSSSDSSSQSDDPSAGSSASTVKAFAFVILSAIMSILLI